MEYNTCDIGKDGLFLNNYLDNWYFPEDLPLIIRLFSLYVIDQVFLWKLLFYVSSKQKLLMVTVLASISLSLSIIQSSGSLHSNIDIISDTCKKGKDTLTGRVIYLTADVEPACEGGRAVLMRRINKGVKFPDSASTNDIQSHYVVCFIVEVNGQITNGRVMQDNRYQIGEQLLAVIKSCRWQPARCNGKKVAMLYKFPVTIEIRTD